MNFTAAQRGGIAFSPNGLILQIDPLSDCVPSSAGTGSKQSAKASHVSAGDCPWPISDDRSEAEHMSLTDMYSASDRSFCSLAQRVSVQSFIATDVIVEGVGNLTDLASTRITYLGSFHLWHIMAHCNQTAIQLQDI